MLCTGRLSSHHTPATPCETSLRAAMFRDSRTSKFNQQVVIASLFPASTVAQPVQSATWELYGVGSLQALHFVHEYNPRNRLLGISHTETSPPKISQPSSSPKSQDLISLTNNLKSRDMTARASTHKQQKKKRKRKPHPKAARLAMGPLAEF